MNVNVRVQRNRTRTDQIPFLKMFSSHPETVADKDA